MAYYYSISVGGWYDTDFAQYTLPEDVVEMTYEEWFSLRQNMNQGQILALDENGKLYWADPPPPPVEFGRAQKSSELRQICTNEIERTNFPSNTLGEVHNYDCRLVDQINLKMRHDIAVSTGQPEPIWASNGTRFEWKNHTASQLMDVMVEMNDHIKAVQAKLAQKLAMVDAATTYATAMAVTWD
jgi:hypothetical protein